MWSCFLVTSSEFRRWRVVEDTRVITSTTGKQLSVGVSSKRLAECGAYSSRFAKTSGELMEALRLRFLVFNLELGEGLEASYAEGYDRDEFDDICDHLIVEERASGKAVGTYRMQTGARAGRKLGYYSAREFDFRPYEGIRRDLVEVGRAAIHRDHRNFEVLNLLWRGIAGYAQEHGAGYLIGCSSVNSQDPPVAAALYHELRDFQVEPGFRTVPRDNCQIAELPPLMTGSEARVPKLLRAYLAIGARICGPPAIDRQFKTIDFLTLLDLDQLSPAAKVRFFGKGVNK
jgi:putative hemolysin